MGDPVEGGNGELRTVSPMGRLAFLLASSCRELLYEVEAVKEGLGCLAPAGLGTTSAFQQTWVQDPNGSGSCRQAAQTGTSAGTHKPAGVDVKAKQRWLEPAQTDQILKDIPLLEHAVGCMMHYTSGT